MKFTSQEVLEILASKVKPDVADEVLRALEKLAEEKKEDKVENTLPKLKNEFAIVVLDEAGEFKDKSLTGFVVKFKEGGDSGAILSKLSEAARAQNEGGSKKDKKNPLLSFTEIFSHLKSKFLKLTNAGVIIQTKTPVRVLFSNNRLV